MEVPLLRLAVAWSLIACFSVGLSGQTTRQADTIVAINGAFSLIAAPGWEKLLLGATPDRGKEMKEFVDFVLAGPQSATGRATLSVTHVDFPKGMTLDMHRRAEDATAISVLGGTQYRPEPASLTKIDGHDAIAWQATMSVSGMTVKIFRVAVLVGTRLYDFQLQASPGDFPSAFEDGRRMLMSVAFRSRRTDRTPVAQTPPKVQYAPISPKTTANAQLAASPKEPHSSVTRDNSSALSDLEKVAACSGEFAWMALVAEKTESKDKAEMKRMAYWFLARATELLGDKALAISSKTVQILSARAEKSGLLEILTQEVAHSGDCISLMTQVLPNTKSCFELSVDYTIGPSYRFKCTDVFPMRQVTPR